MKDKVFSAEIVEFSKVIDETLSYVSKDIKLLGLNTENFDKELSGYKRASKTEISNIKKDISNLKNNLIEVRKILTEMSKKIKRTNVISPPVTKNTNKDEVRELRLEISDLKLTIKNIETKLKMN